MITLLILLFLTDSIITSVCVSKIYDYSLSGSSSIFKEFTSFILSSQQNILQTLEKEENNKVLFDRDYWEKRDPEAEATNLVSYGLTACLQDGALLEKGGVSTTIVTGILSKERAAAISSRDQSISGIEAGCKYYASALSLVLHSRSPLVPTFRSDVRYFEVEKKNGQRSGFFGGGADLTPYTLCDNEIKNFHKQYKQICDRYDSELYRKLKVNCDKYFYIPARLEHRGTGGIFFDDLSELSGKGIESAMEFTKQVCEEFMPSYLPLTKLNSLPYSEEQRNFQLLRRGRYIEFNLLYDRGVRFGLVPGGRIEAVMISCPPLVRWIYNYVAKEGSEEARLISILKNPIDWV